jgi:hypothetical protein
MFDSPDLATEPMTPVAEAVGDMMRSGMSAERITRYVERRILFAGKIEGFCKALARLEGMPTPAWAALLAHCLMHLLKAPNWYVARFAYFDATRGWPALDVAYLSADQTIALIEGDLWRVINATQMASVATHRQAPGAPTATPMLNETERKILRLVQAGPLKGAAIAARLGLTFDYTRQVLSRLRKKGLLVNGADGYGRPRVS